MRFKNVAIVGSSTRVGRDIAGILEDFSFESISFLDSTFEEAGKNISYKKQLYNIRSVENHDFSANDCVFFASKPQVSGKYAPIAAQNAAVIDTSPCFRMSKEAILVIPEVNGEKLDNFQYGIISSPHTCAVPLAVILSILRGGNLQIKRIVFSTYQAVSDFGREAMDELLSQTKSEFGSAFSRESDRESVFEGKIAFNAIPQVGKLLVDGYTSDERGIEYEVSRLLNISPKKINATCVMIPTFVGNMISVNVEFENTADYNYIREILSDNKSIQFFDDADELVTSISGIKNERILISRMRIDNSAENGISFLITWDNLYKGVVLNSVKIAQYLK